MAAKNPQPQPNLPHYEVVYGVEPDGFAYQLPDPPQAPPAPSYEVSYPEEPDGFALPDQDAQGNFARPVPIVINGIAYPCIGWQSQGEGGQIEVRWEGGLRDGMSQFQYDGPHSYYQNNGMDVTSGPFICPPPVATSITISNLDTAYPVYWFIITSTNQFCFVLNKDRIYKIKLSDNTLASTKQFASAVIGQPMLFNGFWEIPCGSAVQAQQLTTVTSDGTADTYTARAHTAGRFILHYTRQTIIDAGVTKFGRAYATNQLEFATAVATDPAATGYSVGDTSFAITHLAVRGTEVIAFKPDNVYGFDTAGNALAMQTFVGKSLDTPVYAGSNSLIEGDLIFYVHKQGLGRFVGNSFKSIGPDTDPRRVDVTLDSFKSFTASDYWRSIAIWGDNVYASYGKQVFYGKLEGSEIRWYGVIYDRSTVCRVMVTDGPTLWIAQVGSIERVTLADDGSPRVGYGVSRGQASTTYEIFLPLLHGGEQVGISLTDKRKQLKRFWVLMQNVYASIQNHSTVTLSAFTDLAISSTAVGASISVSATGDLKERTPTSLLRFYNIMPKIKVVTSSSYTGAAPWSIIAWGVQMLTPQTIRARIDLTSRGLGKVSSGSMRGLRIKLRNLLNANAINYIVAPGDSENSDAPKDNFFVGYIDDIQETAVVTNGQLGWVLDLTISRFDYQLDI